MLLLKLAMVSLEQFQEQFGRLKDVEGRKDELIEVRELGRLFPVSQTVLIDDFTDRT